MSGEDLRGVQGDGGAEGKISFGARTKEAQADQVRRRKGRRKDHAKSGGVKCTRSLALHTDESMSPSPARRKRWMRRRLNRLGLLWQRGRKETGGAFTMWRSWR